MPKLNTTVDNIELKSNKIISTSTISPDEWTDAQYPSAKTLLNISHPVGSILTTAANISPSSTLGGVWELVDKAFKDSFKVIASSDWTPINAYIAEYSGIALADHTMALRINLITTADIGDTGAPLGTLNLQPYGVTALTYAAWYTTTTSDDGNSTVCYGISQEGTISVQEVLNVNDTHTLPKGSSFYIHLVVPVNHSYMIDSFCDKFYWKRTT